MKLHHYIVTITPDGGDPHEAGEKATSAVAALAQIVEAELSHGTKGPVLVLDKDGKLRELRGFKFGKLQKEDK